jgi:hypothetical protein
MFARTLSELSQTNSLSLCLSVKLKSYFLTPLLAEMLSDAHKRIRFSDLFRKSPTAPPQRFQIR